MSIRFCFGVFFFLILFSHPEGSSKLLTRVHATWHLLMFVWSTRHRRMNTQRIPLKQWAKHSFWRSKSLFSLNFFFRTFQHLIHFYEIVLDKWRHIPKKLTPASKINRKSFASSKTSICLLFWCLFQIRWVPSMIFEPVHGPSRLPRTMGYSALVCVEVPMLHLCDMWHFIRVYYHVDFNLSCSQL